MISILVVEYTAFPGFCRGGSNPENKAGKVLYDDLNCKDRCDTTTTCTGYALPVNSYINKCTTYTSEGATGNGNGNKATCYMKQPGIYIQEEHM